MSVQIKFVQGMNVGASGRALVGSAGTSVTASVANAIAGTTYRWSWIDVPVGSAIPIGVITEGPSFISFEPDVAGDFFLQVEAFSVTGYKTNDRRVFRVLDTDGLPHPAFDAEADALNFGGQTRGWKPDMETWFAFIKEGDVSIEIPLFTSGDTTLDIPQRRGSREIDLTKFPSSLGGKTREVKLLAVLNSSHASAEAGVDLYDQTHGVVVTNSFLDNSGAVDPLQPEEFESSALTIGDNAGDLRDDVAALYFARIVRTGGSASDNVTGMSVRLRIRYV